MPYKNKEDRNVAREVELEKLRPQAKAARKVRQAARDKLDAAGVDRTGMDIDHKHGTGAGNGPENLRLRTPSANRSFTRNSDHTMKVNKPKKK
jgi:hypothetical protein